jgi:hypothetical protein
MAREQDGYERSDEQLTATDRLKTALEEQTRLTGRYEAAAGTGSEMNAYSRLREANEQVAAREAWVKWVDRGH